MMKFFWTLSSFALFAASFLTADYTSQFGQDNWLNEHVFKNKENGVFVDIGARDGKSFNNTDFFEKNLNWSGICVEPQPEFFQKLKSYRNCLCVEGGISEQEEVKDFLKIDGYSEMLSGFVEKYDPRHLNRIQEETATHGGEKHLLKVQTFNINNLLEQSNVSTVDLLSLDTEGGELDILKSLDFEKFHIKVIDVENNYDDFHFPAFLETKGYKKIARLGCDEIYILQE